MGGSAEQKILLPCMHLQNLIVDLSAENIGFDYVSGWKDCQLRNVPGT